MGGLYTRPRLYDLAFSYRDVSAEVDVLSTWYERATGRTRPKRVLELAAGPAAHAREFARRGADAVVVDSSAAMCRYATAAARRDGVALTIARADMRAFDVDGRIDLAMCLLDSPSHLLSLDDMVDHLACVRRHLRSDGIYVLEMTHPAELFDAEWAETQQRWRLQRGAASVDVHWATATVDPITQISVNPITIRVRENGEEQLVRDDIALRRWTVTELDAAVRLAGGLVVVARHGGYDTDAPFTGSDGEWRMITVVQRARRTR